MIHGLRDNTLFKTILKENVFKEFARLYRELTDEQKAEIKERVKESVLERIETFKNLEIVENEERIIEVRKVKKLRKK